MRDFQPGDAYIVVPCAGLCLDRLGRRKVLWTIPVWMHHRFFDERGNLRPKFAGANYCENCVKWFKAKVVAAKLLPEHTEEA